MEANKKMLAAAVAALVGIALTAGQTHAATTQPVMEKCYGIAKAKNNDCGNTRHSCAGQATQNSQADEWIFLPKGSCGKIAGACADKPCAEKTAQ